MKVRIQLGDLRNVVFVDARETLYDSKEKCKQSGRLSSGKTRNINVNRENPEPYINFPRSKVFPRYLKYGKAFMNFSVICMVNKKSLLSLQRTARRNFNTDFMKRPFLIFRML